MIWFFLSTKNKKTFVELGTIRGRGFCSQPINIRFWFFKTSATSWKSESFCFFFVCLAGFWQYSVVRVWLFPRTFWALISVNSRFFLLIPENLEIRFGGRGGRPTNLLLFEGFPKERTLFSFFWKSWSLSSLVDNVGSTNSPLGTFGFLGFPN